MAWQGMPAMPKHPVAKRWLREQGAATSDADGRGDEPDQGRVMLRVGRLPGLSYRRRAPQRPPVHMAAQRLVAGPDDPRPPGLRVEDIASIDSGQRAQAALHDTQARVRNVKSGTEVRDQQGSLLASLVPTGVRQMGALLAQRHSHTQLRMLERLLVVGRLAPERSVKGELEVRLAGAGRLPCVGASIRTHALP